MRRYETIFIVDSELSDEGRNPILDRIRDLMQQHKGFLVKIDEWGAKKLAYEIKKKSRGYYICLNYCGHGTLVNEIERFFRIDDRMLKYMTVLLEKDADLDQIKEEMAQAEAEEERIAQELAERKRADEAARKEQAEKAAAEQAAGPDPVVDADPESGAAPEPEPDVAPGTEADASESTPSESNKEEI